VWAQGVQHATWNLAVQPASAVPGSKVLIRAQARVESGWHLYSATERSGRPTSFKLSPETLVENVRILQPPPKRALDPNFNAETETYEADVAFLLEVQL
jgi:thiol:disulfide interchange protein DsbD